MLSSFLKNLTRRSNSLGAAILSCPFLEMFYSCPLSRTEFKTSKFQATRLQAAGECSLKTPEKAGIKTWHKLYIDNSTIEEGNHQRYVYESYSMTFSPQTKIMIILPVRALTGRELLMDVLENRQTKAK